jgi:fructokinase
LILVIGEILFDIFPEYRRIGGAPFNFAFHLKKLGMPVRFISRIGEDEPGREILNFLGQHGFEHDDIQIDSSYETGSVTVELDPKGVPKFDIRRPVAYDYLEFNDHLAALLDQTPRLIYFGSLIQRTACGFDTLRQLVSDKPAKTKTFCDINLRPRCYDKASIVSSLEYSDILKLNHEEFQVLKEMTGEDIKDAVFIEQLMSAHAMEAMVLTKGEEGSQCFMPAGQYQFKPVKIANIVDTVGAGDAYAAMFVFGYLKGWPVAEILAAATSFAARLCTVEGALPPDDEPYQEIMSITKGNSNES